MANSNQEEKVAALPVLSEPVMARSYLPSDTSGDSGVKVKVLFPSKVRSPLISFPSGPFRIRIVFEVSTAESSSCKTKTNDLIGEKSRLPVEGESEKRTGGLFSIMVKWVTNVAELPNMS